MSDCSLAEVDEELSIGDYVLSGGELAAMVVLDVLCAPASGCARRRALAQQDSFSAGLARLPALHRPEEFEGSRVPAVLLGGHHADIERWRLKQSLGRTWRRRPSCWRAVR